MARSTKSSRQVGALKHDAVSRRNIPTAEMKSFFRRAPGMPRRGRL
jgi:adenine-specific DNA-methyltransferase